MKLTAAILSLVVTVATAAAASSSESNTQPLDRSTHEAFFDKMRMKRDFMDAMNSKPQLKAGRQEGKKKKLRKLQEDLMKASRKLHQDSTITSRNMKSGDSNSYGYDAQQYGSKRYNNAYATTQQEQQDTQDSANQYYANQQAQNAQYAQNAAQQGADTYNYASSQGAYNDFLVDRDGNLYFQGRDGYYYNAQAERVEPNEYGQYPWEYDAPPYELMSRSFKYAGCAAIKTYDVDNSYYSGNPMVLNTYAVFRFCPTNSCNPYSMTGCSKNYGEYTVDVKTYLLYLLSYYDDEYTNYCEYCRPCDYDEYKTKNQYLSQCRAELNDLDFQYVQKLQQQAYQDFLNANGGYAAQKSSFHFYGSSPYNSGQGFDAWNGLYYNGAATKNGVNNPANSYSHYDYSSSSGYRSSSSSYQNANGSSSSSYSSNATSNNSTSSSSSSSNRGYYSEEDYGQSNYDFTSSNSNQNYDYQYLSDLAEQRNNGNRRELDNNNAQDDNAQGDNAQQEQGSGYYDQYGNWREYGNWDNYEFPDYGDYEPQNEEEEQYAENKAWMQCKAFVSYMQDQYKDADQYDYYSGFVSKTYSATNFNNNYYDNNGGGNGYYDEDANYYGGNNNANANSQAVSDYAMYDYWMNMDCCQDGSVCDPCQILAEQEFGNCDKYVCGDYYSYCDTPYYNNDDKADDDEGTDLLDFLECNKYETEYGGVYYIAPHCGSDHYTINLGIFSDENCLDYVGDKISLKDVLGYKHNDEELFKFPQECISCEGVPTTEDELQEYQQQQEENQGVYGEYVRAPDQAFDQAFAMCTSLYDLSAQCNKHMKNFEYVSRLMTSNELAEEQRACTFIDNIMEGSYNETGDIQIHGDLFDFNDWRNPRQYHRLRLPVQEATYLALSIILCVALAALACSYQMALRRDLEDSPWLTKRLRKRGYLFRPRVIKSVRRRRPSLGDEKPPESPSLSSSTSSSSSNDRGLGASSYSSDAHYNLSFSAYSGIVDNRSGRSNRTRGGDPDGLRSPRSLGTAASADPDGSYQPPIPRNRSEISGSGQASMPSRRIVDPDSGSIV